MQEPEFEPEFYAKQISMMEERYEKIFQAWDVNWGKYYTQVCKKLRNRQYWIWIFLCGLETFVQDDAGKTKGKKQRLVKDTIRRIRRIVGDSFRIEEYIKSL